MRVGAVRVGEALHGDALDLGVAVEAGLARADGPVLADVALGVAAAGARVLADGVDAGQGGVALVVRLAARLDGRQDVAAAVLCRVVPVRAGAHHGADGQRVGHQAPGGRDEFIY